jgi:hypothetical protein
MIKYYIIIYVQRDTHGVSNKNKAIPVIGRGGL